MRGVVVVALAACYRDAPSPASTPAPAATPPSLAVATSAVIASLDSGDDASIAEYLDGGSIRLEGTCPVCDDPEGTGVEEGAGVASTPVVEVLDRAAFIAFVRNADQRLERGPISFRAPVELTCDDACCAGPTGPLAPNQRYVTEVCFRPGAKLASITYLDATE